MDTILLGELPSDETAKRTPHSYVDYEMTALWRALQPGINDLVKNQDLKELAHRDYIVGYLCKVLTTRKKKFFA